MYIQPENKPLNIEQHQYMLIDQSVIGEFSEYLDHVIVLAPDFNILQKNQYPVLLKFFALSDEQKIDVLNHHETFLSYYKQPLFSIMFVSEKIISDENIQKFFKRLFYVERNEKHFLRRVYDPRVIVQLNWYCDDVDILSHIFPIFSQLSIYLSEQIFSFNLNQINEDIFILNTIDLTAINLINRLIGLLKVDMSDLSFLEHLSIDAYRHLEIIRTERYQVLSTYDAVALLFHMRLLGEAYLSLDAVKQLLNVKDGYEKASKAMEISKWNNIFYQLNVNDINLKNKVMYDY